MNNSWKYNEEDGQGGHLNANKISAYMKKSQTMVVDHWYSEAVPKAGCFFLVKEVKIWLFTNLQHFTKHPQITTVFMMMN